MRYANQNPLKSNLYQNEKNNYSSKPHISVTQE